jgi:hypothetical protein
LAATPKKLYSGTPGTSAQTLYTVPANVKTIVKNVVVCNVTGSSATITLNVSGVPFVSANPVSNNDTLIMDLSLVLEPGDTLTGLQGTSSALRVIVSGVEVS